MKWLHGKKEKKVLLISSDMHVCYTSLGLVLFLSQPPLPSPSHAHSFNTCRWLEVASATVDASSHPRNRRVLSCEAPTYHWHVWIMHVLCLIYGRVGEKPAAQGVQVPPSGPAFPTWQFEYCDTHHTHTYNVNENGRAWWVWLSPFLQGAAHWSPVQKSVSLISFQYPVETKMHAQVSELRMGRIGK